MSFDELEELIYVYIVDVYQRTAIPGIGVPNELWDQHAASFGIRPSEEVSQLFAKTATRKLTEKGVKVLGLYYHCPELADMSNYSKEVIVRGDVNDLNSVYVFNSATNKYSVVPAVDQKYTSHIETWWRHDLVQKDMKKQLKAI